ncbi:dipeptide ABC transporter ATP-binding protein [Leifsonia shinshuensis]|uniref:Peptide/nickel transport system ATP-binding protein n=1 Tax=Leifsonia shinshuensis TaxID=150026 RepID=A0A853CN61_9MICO|nr:ABC transporter ATP-binding protein [Leifsonia shinshuensis]NYJ22286.1 peptide/nickel transport system ATP-binding protein [Leifsonia shinshuensis]
MSALLEIDDLRVRYHSAGRDVEAVRGIGFEVAAGERVAVVGESGSGKSTTAAAIVRLLAANATVSGAIRFAGDEVSSLGERSFRGLLGRRIGYVPQDPTVSLNPVKTIGQQVAEVLSIHRLADRRAAHEHALEALERAGIDRPAERAAQYPHQLSGGQRQRVLIAIALAARPELVIADEPTSALDVTVQRRILDHLDELTDDLGASTLLITHDLGIAADRADRILVLSEGRLVESGTPDRVLGSPQHAYTRALLAAAPSLNTSGGTFLTRARAERPESTDPQEPGEPLLIATGLVKDFGGNRAVDDVSLAIHRGRTLALVGESGSGKTTTSRLVLRLDDPTAGRIVFDGEDITAARGAALRRLRRRIQVVHQNPYASLNPRFRIADLVAEPLRSHGIGTRQERAARARLLLDQVGLPSDAAERRPSELSGGQRQRVAIARALAIRPDLVVLDEPVSALDVRVQAQVLDLLASLQAELGVAYLFISHDLAVVRQVSDDVAVLREGRVVETGTVAGVFDSPDHPYTRDLLEAIPGRSAPLTPRRTA